MSEEQKDQDVTEEATSEAPVEETAEAPAAEEAAPAEAKQEETEGLDSLGLSKPLDKMTAKELRQLAMEKIPQITGASGMSKEELVGEIKGVFGIVDEEGAVSPYKKQIGNIKREINGLRDERLKATSRKNREILRKKINKLKKRSRRLARAV